MKTPGSRRIKRLMMIMGVSVFPLMSQASGIDGSDVSLKPDSLSSGNSIKVHSHFTWGAEFGTSVDMSGYDSSTFNVDAMVGYRNSYINMLGFGAGVHRSMGSGDNYVPLYVVMRTSFSKIKRLLFMNFKAGYSFNTIGDASTFGDVNASLGVGINLASGKTFQSYLILGYEFRHFNQRNKSKVDISADDVSLVSLSFGVNF